MRPYFPKNLKKLVAERAGYRCEYCRVHEKDSFLPFEIDHIVSLKHGGGNEISNLAFACPHCNQHKGTDLVTFLKSYGDIVAIFNPRTQKWEEHFTQSDGQILPKTRVAEATIKLLRFNELERIIHRQLLMEIGAWP